MVEKLRRAQAVRRVALGRLEMAVLDRLWSAGAADVGAMHEAVGAPRRLSRNTIQSTLERLVRKGLAERTKLPAALSRVADRAIQVHGALGVTADLPLEAMYRGARTLRLADGPDEVHRILIAKNVLAEYHRGDSWDFGS